MEIRQRDGIRNRRFSFNPLTLFQTWDPSQEEEREWNEPRAPRGFI
jgi:hypothetical protein